MTETSDLEVQTPGDASGVSDASETDNVRAHDAAGYPVLPTAVDAAGNERIVGRTTDGWRPAPVEPDPKHVAAMERANAREAEAKQTRTNALVDESRLDETAQPLVDANAARDAEHEQALADREAAANEPVQTGADGVPVNLGEQADASTQAAADDGAKTDNEAVPGSEA